VVASLGKVTEKYVSLAFPGQLQDIRACYATHPEIREMCQDFEEVAQLLVDLKANPTAGESREIFDLENTLAGLHSEIAYFLKSVDEGRQSDI
jgi:hypothetical protein